MNAFSLELFLPSPTTKIDFEKVKENPSLVPKNPGVYVFEREEGDYSYSGRAESLRTRFRQHINESHNDGLKDDIEAGKIKSYFYFLCDTELDAIVLERYFIQGNYYRGKHNIQYVKAGGEVEEHDEEETSENEYEQLLKQEQAELEQMLKEDEAIKTRLFEKFSRRIRNKLENIQYIGRKNVLEVYAKELFHFLFGYIKYTKHTSLNWTKFKEDLDGKTDEELVHIIDDLCHSKVFRQLLKPLDKARHHYILGKYKFEIKKEVGEDTFYFEYTASNQYNQYIVKKRYGDDIKYFLSTKEYIEKYIK